MDRSSLPPAPKDDDSWGKLASDLFGIDLGPQDDFDFAAAEKPVEPPAPPVVAAAPVPKVSEPEVSFEEELTDDDDEAADGETAAQDGVEPERDDYWDALETWDWNEGERAREKRSEGGQSSERTTSDEGGRRSGGGRAPRGRSSREGAPREERSRPPRGESRRSETPRSESAEEKPAAPRRESAEPRSGEQRSQSDRPRRPASSGKPAAEGRAPAPQSRNRPPVKKKPVSTDEFGAGLDEEQFDLDTDWESEAEQSPPVVRVASERLDEDDFDAGINDAESADAEDQDAVGEEQDRPKRRRRRRRRGRATGERTEATAAGGEPSDEFGEEESTEVRAADEEDSSEERSAEGEDSGDSEERPRRRRRRRRRRPGSPAAEGAPARAQNSDEDDEDDDDDEEDLVERSPRKLPVAVEPAASHFDEVFDDEEEGEPIQRVSYDDVPTWDEAISYLVKAPPGDSRGRGGRDQGGNRGRRPPARRPRNDAPPNS